MRGTSPTSVPLRNMPIEEVWSQTRGIIRLTGKLETPEAFGLVDAIQDARDYYHYDGVELHIADCPGGTHDALQFVLDHRGIWTDSSFTLRTVALTQVASAGALLVSMGTRGHRVAMPGARLLWHGVRYIAGEAQHITLPLLHDLRSSLRESEQTVLDQLVVNGAADSAARPNLRNRYQELFNQERWITAQEAIEYALLDGLHQVGAPLASAAALSARR